MKLIYENLEDVFEWEKDEIPVIVIENISFRNRFIQDVYDQSNTLNEQPFYLSESTATNKPLKFETIVNLFNLEVNQTAIINKVRKILEGLIQEDLINSPEVMNKISAYLNNIAMSLPVNVELEGNLNIKRMSQLFELTVADDSTNLVEKILNYLQVNIQLGINEAFIFINLKQFITKEELIEIYKQVRYEEMIIILIENEVRTTIDNEKVFLIDDDLCLIY